MVIENSFLFLRKFSVQSYELRPNHVGHSIKSQFDDLLGASLNKIIVGS